MTATPARKAIAASVLWKDFILIPECPLSKIVVQVTVTPFLVEILIVDVTKVGSAANLSLTAETNIGPTALESVKYPRENRKNA